MRKIRTTRTLTVAASEAGQRFAHYLREVEHGHELTITRNGHPVARMSKIPRPLSGKARERAIEQTVKMMKRGLPMVGIGRRLTRDDMYE